ncbi:putative membrane protein [Streptomyces davaonensis JCM 4913]|uniref:Putative membrane protein n=1 Tax=Streptomyces davaonensis (strain DSM 101723 / JCM 4913 / KCC S-0913 / 768) TaxID=1214101 RepID=K4QSQ1_STRDJ|nr:YrdB family protein [Streptomyces davaonensis]CCK25041.1 putative membrane protein [Streptomyces davaonensis JCM 4913]
MLEIFGREWRMAGAGGGAAGLDARPWDIANEALAFLLEIAALGFLGWWGFSAGHEGVPRILLGVGTPSLAILVWGLFAAPRARWRPRLALVLVVKALVLGGGAAALYAVGHPVAAGVVAVVTAVNTAVAEYFRASPSGVRSPDLS